MSTHPSILAWRIPWTEESLLDLPAVPQQGSFDPFKKALSAHTQDLPNTPILAFQIFHKELVLSSDLLPPSIFPVFLSNGPLCRIPYQFLHHSLSAYACAMYSVLFLPYPSKSNSKQRLSYV